MKTILIALALSLGFSYASFAQSTPRNSCHIEGSQFICNSSAK